MRKPVCWLDQSTSLPRAISEDHRGRFGGFASLPLPDVDGALLEIAYALDTLKLDGVVRAPPTSTAYTSATSGWIRSSMSSTAGGAVVFIHPTSPICWQQSALGYPRPMIEFMFDSTRAVVNLIFSWYDGALSEAPHHRASCRWHTAVSGASTRHVRPWSRRRQRECSGQHRRATAAAVLRILQARRARTRSRRYSR